MLKLIITFERATKNTYVYTAPHTAVTSLYIGKGAMTSPPHQIEVTINEVAVL